jgi:tetratricopeptide (TPR) repeat protein
LKHGRRLAFFLVSGKEELTLSYRIQALNPGAYHFPPARLASFTDPSVRAHCSETDFRILEADAPPPSGIRPTPDELYQVGTAAAADQPELAIQKLEQLTSKHKLRPPVAKEVLAKLLFASIEVSDHQRMVKYFELAKEKNPSLVIPFDKIEPVQQAYRSLEAYEPGLHLARGRAEARFLSEVRQVGILETQNETAESLRLLKQLVDLYPDNALTAQATYAFSQVIYNRADQVRDGVETEGFDRAGLLDEVVELMATFLGRHPSDPQGPAAVYSLASALLERDDPARAVAWCGAGLKRHPESDLSSAIAYLKAFSHFRLGQYNSSLKLCRQVVESTPDEDSREMARYIMAQIHHAKGNMSQALELYRKVRDRFRDADETVMESERILLVVPEVVEVAAGRRPVLSMTTRNLRHVDLRAYRVDPAKLYLLKGSLDDLREVNLAGIRPVFSRTDRIDAQVGVTRETQAPLKLPGKGAYLLLARGGHILTHSLVLVGSLRCQVTEDADEGRVRVTVMSGSGKPVVGARVHLKGSSNDRFTVGQTDLRGIFIASDIEGALTVIASHNGSWGLYRGTQELTGQVEPQPDEVRYRKKTVIDFSDDLIEGEMVKPDMDAGNFFQQDVKGMSVEQAK